MQNKSYQQYDQQVHNIINKVLSKHKVPVSISNNPQNTSRQPFSNLHDSVPIQRNFPSNLYSTIPESSIQNYQLQIQNKQLRDTFGKLSEKLKKFQHKKSKQSQKVNEIQQLKYQLSTIIQSNRSLQSELNSFRLSRYQMSTNTVDLLESKATSINIETRKFCNKINKSKSIQDTKKQSQSCCQKVRKYKQIIKALRKSQEKRFLTDSNNTKSNVLNNVPKISDKSKIYIEGQCHLVQSFKIQQSKFPLYQDSEIQVQESQLQISQVEQYKATISEQIQNQKQYIKSLQKIISQQQKILADYEKQIEQTARKNKTKDAGKFIKNKSKSNLKTNRNTLAQNSGGKIQQIQSLARLNAVTDRLQSCPSTGIILRKYKTGK